MKILRVDPSPNPSPNPNLTQAVTGRVRQAAIGAVGATPRQTFTESDPVRVAVHGVSPAWQAWMGRP